VSRGEEVVSDDGEGDARPVLRAHRLPTHDEWRWVVRLVAPVADERCRLIRVDEHAEERLELRWVVHVAIGERSGVHDFA